MRDFGEFLLALLVGGILGIFLFEVILASIAPMNPHYRRGYACAVAFEHATTRADSLQLKLDGCRWLEVEG